MSQSRASSNNELAKFIEYYIQNFKNKNLEFEVRFGTLSRKPFIKDDIDNVIKKLLSQGFKIKTSNEYKLNITSEYIDIRGNAKRNSNIRTEIYGIQNIRRYCKTNLIQEGMYVKYLQKNIEKLPGLFNPFNVKKYNLRYSIQEENDIREEDSKIQSLKSSWGETKKYFRLLNRIELEHPNYPFRIDISSVKSSQKQGKNYVYTYTIEESQLFNRKSHYEIEIEFDNEKVRNNIYDYTQSKDGMINLFKSYEKSLKHVIKLVLSGLQETNFPVDYFELKNIMNDYLKLVDIKKKTDKFGNPYDAIPDDFIGPSTITLQKKNIIDNPNSKEPIILDNYTVTEKADGIRKMLYISKNGKIYLITMNMKIEFTGAITQNSNLFNSLFDGEHVLYSKTGTFINKYLAFDAYFVQGKDIRQFKFIEKERNEKEIYRLVFLIESFSKSNIKIKYIAPTNPNNLSLDSKDFFLINKDSEDNNLFNSCRLMIEKQKSGSYEYETDGLIFTPQLVAVGDNNMDIDENKPSTFKPNNSKAVWKYSFKWKPPKYNTIDFLVEIVKQGGKHEIKMKQDDGINMGKKNMVTYKTLKLKVGYNQDHGFANPQLAMIEGKEKIDELIELMSERRYYKPGLFYPTNPYDNKAHLCKVELRTSPTSGQDEILTEEDNEVIEDNSIVEFKYVMDNDEGWRWVPLRVRHDKTMDLRLNNKNFGNAYHVANNNWQSIHNPITEEMLSTGDGIYLDSSDDDVYYKKKNNKRKKGESNQDIMRDFHNLFVKRILIQSYSNSETKLLDFAVGRGGDFPKWIHSNLDFVFGVDISRDNIENKIDSACTRFIKYTASTKKMPKCMFLHADSSKDLLNGEAYYDERSFNIQKALIGIGPKDKKQLGAGVYDLYGIANKMFDVTSIQFALHYMFKDTVSLHTFLRNVSNFTKIGGHFIGTCYDGKRMFKYLEKVELDGSRNIIIKDKKFNSIIKKYDSEQFLDDESCVGYEINVYQESIDQYISEYLVNFDYFIELMQVYGFKPASNKFIKTKPEAIGGFEELFNLLMESNKQNKEYENIKDMRDEEKIVSFMNNYFVFIKTTEVDVNSIFNTYVKKTSMNEGLDE